MTQAFPGTYACAGLCLVVSLLGCTAEDVQLSWEFDFADESLRARAMLVEGTIREGGCTSTIDRYVGRATVSESPPAPPLLPPGRYGFAGRARDADCTWFAEACIDVDVPRGGGAVVVVTLADATETAACSAVECNAGICETDPVDAGPDGGPDSSRDAGPDAAVDSDVGDGGCGADGTACAGGTCHGGACCTGCWDGTACLGGGDAAACGTGGVACEACDCDCTAGACTAPTVGEIAAGAFYSCAILDTGELYCWGDNEAGQLGLGTSGAGSVELSPVQVGVRADWSGLGAGDEHTCSIPTDHSLYCWGDNEDGQLGSGDLLPLSTPGRVETDSDWDSVEGGRLGDHTCMLKTDDSLYCMGQNNYGQLGIGTGTDAHVPTQVPGTWASISLGHHHSCGIRMDGTLWCWGENIEGQLGLGTLAQHSSPQQVGTESDWDAIGLGDAHSCAIRGGQLYCWGNNAMGQLGTGGSARQMAPALIGTDTDWAAVTGGLSHTCALKSTGQVFCSGSDTDGQLGDGRAGGVSMIFGEVTRVTGADAIVAGELHSCARAGDGSILCWGGNGSGALGQGHRVSNATPIAVCVGS